LNCERNILKGKEYLLEGKIGNYELTDKDRRAILIGINEL